MTDSATTEVTAKLEELLVPTFFNDCFDSPAFRAGKRWIKEEWRYVPTNEEEEAAALKELGDALEGVREAGGDDAMDTLMDRLGGDGWNLLHLAVMGNSAKAVQVVLAAGAKLNVKASNYETEVHAAARNQNAEIVDLLAHAGSKLDLPGSLALTPAGVAANWEAHEVIKMLDQWGVDTNVHERVGELQVEA